MADTIIATEIQLNAQSALHTVSDLQQAIEQLSTATQKAGEEGNTALGQQYAQQAAEAQKQIDVLGLSINNLGDISAKTAPLLNIGQTLSAGFTAAMHSATLFAHAGAATAQQLRGLEAAMMLKQGLAGFNAGVLSFKQLDNLLPSLQLGFKGLSSTLSQSGGGVVRMAAQWQTAEQALNKSALTDWQTTQDKKLTVTRQFTDSVMQLSQSVFAFELEQAGTNQKKREAILKR